MIAYHFSPSDPGMWQNVCSEITPEQSSETLTWPMKNWTARLLVAGRMSADAFWALKTDIRKLSLCLKLIQALYQMEHL